MPYVGISSSDILPAPSTLSKKVNCWHVTDVDSSAHSLTWHTKPVHCASLDTTDDSNAIIPRQLSLVMTLPLSLQLVTPHLTMWWTLNILGSGCPPMTVMSQWLHRTSRRPDSDGGNSAGSSLGMVPIDRSWVCFTRLLYRPCYYMELKRGCSCSPCTGNYAASIIDAPDTLPG